MGKSKPYCKKRILFKIILIKMHRFTLLLAQLSAVSLAWDWIDGGQGDLKHCYKSTYVLGIYICTSKKAFDEKKELCDHIASVTAQLLDNDEDGVPDDSAVHEVLTKGWSKWIMIVPEDMSDYSYFNMWDFSSSVT